MIYKTNYEIEWLLPAENKLKAQAEWIKENSLNEKIASEFYNSVKKEVEKLSFVAAAYKQQ